MHGPINIRITKFLWSSSPLAPFRFILQNLLRYFSVSYSTQILTLQILTNNERISHRENDSRIHLGHLFSPRRPLQRPSAEFPPYMLMFFKQLYEIDF